MIIQKGKKNTAIIYADKIDKQAKIQIASILRSEAYSDCKIRFMPDIHAGKYVPVGTTMTLGKALSPTILGSDIGCGVCVSVIKNQQVDFQALDSFIRSHIPSGAKIREKPILGYNFSKLFCAGRIDSYGAARSMGTLGGGNHFIELDRCTDGTLLLLVHSGSRRLGADVMNYYQKKTIAQCAKSSQKCFDSHREEMELFSVRGRSVKSTVRQYDVVMKNDLLAQYLNDVCIVLEYAELNRTTIADMICSAMDWKVLDRFSCIHNYIDIEHGILRKGAISARKGERVAIPLNMRDGVILGVGQGNPEWNFSAPHGAGRVFPRNEAKHHFSVESFRKEMEGIYTTSVNDNTLDECPMVYKSSNKILYAITDCIEISEIAKPIYNFKA